MAQKFLTDIEVTRGLVDSSGDLGVAGQVLSSTGSSTNWITNEANSTVVYLDEFTGDNSTVDFTISVSVTDENITQVYIDGVYQNKDTYSVSGTTLTFSTAPPLNADIEVITFSTATTSDDLSAGSVIIPVKNTHTASIAKGEPVYITGNVGASARLEIAPADASNSAKMPAAGLLLQTLAVNAEGYVITGGYLRNITTDTIDGTSTTSNDTVYVKSGGGLTMTKPTGTNLIQNIAKVARSSGGNSGSLLVSSILRTNDVPNITNDYFWLGNSSGVATPTEFTSTARGLLSVGAEGTAAGDGNLAYNNSSGVFTYTPPVLGGLSGTTDDITEGSTNLYYTDARSRSSISAGGDLSYNSTTGVMSYTTPTTIASLSNHDTDDLAEGAINLYYTDTRVGTYLTNNSYATQSYVNTQVSNLVDSAPSTLDTLNELAAALGDDANFSTTITTSIGTKWTEDSAKITNWDTAYSWGNHASAGYLTSFDITTQTDPKYLRSDANDTATGTINFTGNMTAKNTKFLGGTSYNENIRMHPSSNDYSSLVLGAVSGDSGTGTGQWSLVRYPNPTHQQKFTIRHNSTDHVTITTAGNLTNHVDTRSPIFYSSSDSNYYLYPNNQLSLKVYGEIANSNYAQGSMQPGALNIGRIDTDYRWDGTTWASDVRLGMLMNFSEYYEIGFHDSGDSVNSFVYYNGSDFEMGRDIGWGTQHFTFTESVRSPWFYDSGNTGYYVNPAFTSNLNALNVGGAAVWTSGNDGAGSGLDADTVDGIDSASFVRSDANDTLSGQYTFTKTNDHAIRVGTIRGTAVGSQSGQFIQMYERVNIGGPSGWGASNTATPSYGLSTYGGTRLAVYTDYTESGGSMRAPVFYDSDNTNYYVNPTGTSNLSKAIFNTSSTGLPRQITIKEDGDTENSMGSYPGAWTSALNIQSNDGSTYLWFSPLTSNIPRIQTNYGQLDFYTGSNTNRALHLSGISARSEIFYDLNDTGYYLNPNATSNLSAVTIDGDLRVGGTTKFNVIPSGWSNANADQWPYLYWHRDTANGWDEGLIKNSSSRGFFGKEGWGIHMNSNKAFHVFSSGWTANFGVEHGGNAFASGQMRAPIFYDYNNTGYYLDPNSTGAISAIKTAGGAQIGTTTAHKLVVAGAGNYMNINYDQIWNAAGNLHFQYSSSGNIDMNYGGGYAFSRTSLRAPIFYDYNNTGFYTDPASISILNGLQFGFTQHGSANNIRMGNQTTMNAISSGTNNAAFGVEALGNCTTGSRNFAYGYAALYSLSSGGNNIAMGDATGYNVTSGSNNLLFGHNAGRTGYQTPQSIAGVTTGSNQIHMGNESHTTARIQISWTVNSDARDKTDVEPIGVGLDFVNQLNPVTFRWDKRSDYEDRTPTGENKLEELTLGFLAQEVETVEKAYGYDVATKTNLVVDRDVENDGYGLTYEKMIPILTKAIQELKADNDSLRARIQTLEDN